MFGSILGNCFGTVYFLYYQFIGILLFRMILKKNNRVVSLMLGSVAGTILLHWIPVVVSFFFGFGIISNLWAALIVCPVVFIFISNSDRRNALQDDGVQINKIIKKHSVFGVVLILFMILWCYLLYNHNIRLGDDGAIYTGQCGYGDMNMHLGFLTSIAVQGTFPPDYSIFPGTKLAYPFLSDSISSSLYIFGASLRWAYTLPMIVAFLQVACGMYMLAYSFTRSVRKSTLSILFFLLNGGFGFAYFLNWSSEPKYKFLDIFTGFYTTPTNLTVENIRWSNMIADMLLPQRATLFGYAILFSTIYLLYKAVFDGERRYYYIAAVFGGSLPLIHTHSFLAFGLISASYLLMYLYSHYKNGDDLGIRGWHLVVVFIVFMILIQILLNKEIITQDSLMPLCISLFVVFVVYGLFLIVKHIQAYGYRELFAKWGVFIIIVALLAIPQLVGFTFGQVSEGGFVRGCFNWGNQGEFYLWFYIKNIGIVLLLAIPALCYSSKRTFRFAFPILPICLLAEMIAFAPNNYDNNKLLYVAYMFMCIVAADYGVELYKKMRVIKGSNIIAWGTVFMALISGILTLGREAYSELQLYARDQVEMAKWIENNTKPDAVFLTSDRHNNIIPSMTGRNIVCGAGSFLYFHGINTSERMNDEKIMFEHPRDAMNLYNKYDVDYVCYSPYEWGNYEIDKSEYDALFEKVFEYENTILYKVIK